ncbi:MAG: AmmeMemoRadiSam system radical SAM enzyme [Candidatus Omnitrophota bacterium]
MKKGLLFLVSAGVSMGLADPFSKKALAKMKTLALREGMFYRGLGGSTVRCGVCFRKCVIEEGRRGFCRNKENIEGKLYNLVHSRPSAVHVDPIEKEPAFHVIPGTSILCFGTAGCNFRCKFCQNWHLSQRPIEEMNTVYDLPPEKAVKLAMDKNIPTLSFTYNDPIAFYEYVYDTARIGKQKGLKVLWHSNGTLNPEPLRELLKYTDAVTFDLKAITDEFYRDLSSAKIEPALEALKIIKKEGVWLEIVNLLIPTMNDDPRDVRKMCEWIKDNLGKEVPLHFSRFYPAYKLTNLHPTPVRALDEAHRIASDVGLEYVTIGNVPGHKYNSTYCPNCKQRLIHRYHFKVFSNNVQNGKCRFCGHPIPGIWS